MLRCWEVALPAGLRLCSAYDGSGVVSALPDLGPVTHLITIRLQEAHFAAHQTSITLVPS